MADQKSTHGEPNRLFSISPAEFKRRAEKAVPAYAVLARESLSSVTDRMKKDGALPVYDPAEDKAAARRWLDQYEAKHGPYVHRDKILEP